LALALGAASAASAQSSSPDLSGAARELARKTVVAAGKGEAVSVGWRDASSLGSAALAQARGAFEAALREAGGRLSDVAPAAEAQITLSESQTQYLLVAEFRKGDDRQVWISGWSRTASPAGVAGSGVMLDTRLVWEQPEQMLDVALNGDAMIVLSSSSLARFTRFARSNGQWVMVESTAVPVAKPLPRDMRGRVRWNGAIQASLPGVACSGAAEAVQCRSSEEPWPLGSGGAQLFASLAPGRNYFNGHVVTPAGTHKTVPPFYSAAAAEDGGRTVWVLATVDGGAQIFDAGLDPIGPAGSWGSDITGVDVRCGGRTVVLASRAGDGRGPDAVRAYAVVNRAAEPLGAPAELPGPVTALWSAGSGAIAIVKNGATGLYQAFSLTVVCGQ
jgi:hypothetical protein